VILELMIPGIAWMHSGLNFFMHEILIFLVYFPYIWNLLLLQRICYSQLPSGHETPAFRLMDGHFSHHLPSSSEPRRPTNL